MTTPDTEPIRLVVLGDSTAFTIDSGPQLPAHKALYPNVVAAAMETALQRPVSLQTLARSGADMRVAYGWVTKDRHAQFEVLARADAVIVGISSFDHAPAGVPPVLEAIVPYLRPRWVRHTARTAMLRAYPYVTRATGSRLGRTPMDEFERLYGMVLFQVRALTQGAAGVVMGPIGHRSRYYGWAHPNRETRERRQFEIAAEHGFATVACWPLVEPLASALNPDGVHWPPAAHEAVGEALAAPLIAQLGGDAPKPAAPALGERP